MSSGGSPRSARISGGILGADFVTSDFEFITSESCMSLPPLIDAHGLLPHAAPACNAMTGRARRECAGHPPPLIFFKATQGALGARVQPFHHFEMFDVALQREIMKGSQLLLLVPGFCRCLARFYLACKCGQGCLVHALVGFVRFP